MPGGAYGDVSSRGRFADLGLREWLFGLSAQLTRCSGVCDFGAPSSGTERPRRRAGPCQSSASSNSTSLRPGAARCSTVMTICLLRQRRCRLLSPQAYSSDEPR